MAIAGLGIILGAIYMLNMVQNVAYGSKKEMEVKDLTWNETAALYAVVVMIIVLGVYPNMILNLL
jgi:NADH-quinone oxidoreductase subunit M